jgi:hypothetical protein
VASSSLPAASERQGLRPARQAENAAVPFSAEGITLGVIPLIVGFIASIAVLRSIGIALVLIGAVLALLGRAGMKVGGRAHWF